MADHDGSDEYDFLLEGLGNVDWSIVDGMQPPLRNHQAPREQRESRSSDLFTGIDDSLFDDSFLDEVGRIESQALAIPGTGRLQGRFATSGTDVADIPSAVESTRNSSDSDLEQVSEFLPPLNTPSRSNSRVLKFCPEYHTPTNPLKRRISSPPVSSPHKRRRKCNAKQRATQLVQTFESALECPICFDIIAGAHMLSCGHTGCVLCLCKWIKACRQNKPTCPICRNRVYSRPKPNYIVDEMATQFFDKLQSTSEDQTSLPDREGWERRTAEGKAEYNKTYFPKTRNKSPSPSTTPNLTGGFRPYQAELTANNTTRDFIVITEQVVVVPPYR
ncbi:hypothetical protein M422DRAFT_778784 [Sphaerobolus stellatus SS14]|uniref:RING-type domain-containing protein n=1 Tax=Sphaerobolus stellatus (strain SS14) TaxID=990650 RepID=A0A0C9W1W1_SPHS4|nr:hypothetical protein M422DRAFT_778784 [Sphaerobolus stellatus SS14]